ncbi:putative reverse transcriptase domain-containing protein [Tanacetum coccineum]
MDTNNNPSRSKNVSLGLIWGLGKKETLWGNFPSAQVPFSPQWPVHPEVPQVQQAPKGNGCFECGAPGHFKRDYPKLKNKDGGNGNAQGWVYAVGNAEKRGNASTLGPEAYAMTWEVLKKKMTNKYCLQGEIKKLEALYPLHLVL